MNTLLHDAATDRLAHDNALLLAKLAQLEAKLDAVLSQVEPVTPATPVPEQPPLTPRKLDVLRRVAEGKSNRAIADELCLTAGTVKNYLKDINRTLDARSRWHAVVIAHARGLLEGGATRANALHSKAGQALILYALHCMDSRQHPSVSASTRLFLALCCCRAR